MVFFLEPFCKNNDLYIEKIYRFIFFKVSNVQDAQDLTSEVFLKAWQYIKDGKKIKSFLKKRDIEFDIEDVTKFFTEEEEEETLDSFLENITDEYIFDKLGIEQSN